MTEPGVQLEGRSLRRDALSVTGVIVLSAVLMGPAISLFFNTPVMAGNAGAAVPLVFVISMIGIAFTASSVAEYSKKIASAGSFYGFIHSAAGRKAGFLAGWCTFGAYLGAAVGGALITGAFTSSIVDAHFGVSINYFWYALVTVVLIVLASIRGIRLSERISLVMLGIELAAIAIVVVAILVQGGADGLSLKPFSMGGADLSGIRLAMVFGILSFVGFEISATLAEETRNPLRSIPIAVIGCTLVIGLIYVIGSYAVVMGYGTGATGALAKDASAFDTLAREYASPLRPVVDLVLINALFGATLAVVNTFARVAFALGRDRILPRWLGTTSSRYSTPSVALLSFGVVAIASGAILAASNVDGLSAYAYVSTPASLLLILVFIAANLLLWRLYRSQYPSDFNGAKHVVMPVLGSLVLLLPLVAQFYPAPPSPFNILPIFALAWLVVGAVLAITMSERTAQADHVFAGQEPAERSDGSGAS